jgi:tetratricopeptide (TPR) repeat protein
VGKRQRRPRGREILTPIGPMATARTPDEWESLWSDSRKSQAFSKLPAEMRADVLTHGADLYLQESRHRNVETAALERCLALWREAVELVPIGSRHWTPYRLHNLLIARWRLFEQKQDRELFPLIKSLSSQLVDDNRTGDDDAQTYQVISGLASLQQFQLDGDWEHMFRALEVAVELLGKRRAANQTKAFVGRVLDQLNPRRADLLSYAGFSNWLDSVFPALAAGGGNLPSEAATLTGALFEFYKALPVTESTAKAAAIASAVFDAAPRDWAELGIAYFDLALVFRDLHKHTADREYVNRAIKTMETAIDHLPPEQSATAYYELGRLRILRAETFGTFDDLDSAVSAFESALKYGAAGSEAHANTQRILTLTRLMRGVLDGSSEGVDEHELLLNLAEMVRTADLDKRTEYAQTIGFFGNAIGARYETTGNLADLDRSAALVTLAYFFGREDPMVKGLYATALLARYNRAADHSDLDKVLRALSGIDLDAIEDRGVRAGLHDNLARALEFDIARSGAVDRFEEVVRLRRNQVKLVEPGNPAYAAALARLAAAVYKQSQYTDAIEDLRESEQLFERAAHAAIDGRTTEMIAGNRALVSLARARMSGQIDGWARAIDGLRANVQKLAGRDTPDRPAALDNFLRGLLRRFDCFGQLADLSECIATGEAALAEARESRASGTMQYRLGHQVLWYRVYEDLVDAYLMLAGRAPASARRATWRAFEISETVKGDVFLHAFASNPDRVNTLAEFFPLPEYTPAMLEALVSMAAGERPVTIDYLSTETVISSQDIVDLCKRLGPDTAFISAFSSETQTWWFVMTADCDLPRVFKTSISRLKSADIFMRLIREVVVAALPGEESWLHGLDELRALGPPLVSAKRLIISNHQWTCRLPWAIITRRLDLRGAHGDPLPVMTVPNLKYALSSDARTSPAPGAALVVGNPGGDLEHAAEEAHVVGELLGADPLTGQAATIAAVFRLLESAEVIHFASHAILVDAPGLVRLRLVDGELSFRDILERRVCAKLVVLSACASGVAEKFGREEFVGLAEAFLIAGARNVVATHWPVDDACAAFLMRAFYTEWLRGAHVADALETAIGDVSRVATWQHPHWWGAFFAMGRSAVSPPSHE